MPFLNGLNSLTLNRITGLQGRPEIIIEGSLDGQKWLEYNFFYKPGQIDEIPDWVMPHQPRVDWQMWFAALANINREPWLVNLVYKLLHNDPVALRIIKNNPFPTTPPKFIQIKEYKYFFTTPSPFSNEENSNWNASVLEAYWDPEKYWRREYSSVYLSPQRSKDKNLVKYLRESGFLVDLNRERENPVHPWQNMSVFEILAAVLLTCSLPKLLLSRFG